MYKLIKCEFFKLKSMYSIIAAFLFPLAAILIGFFNIHRGIIKISNSEEMWNAIYIQNSSLYGGLLFPVFLCILISLQWRIEFKNNNINNLLLTDISQSRIYLSKIITTFLIAAFNIILYILIIFAAVKIFLPTESVKSFIFYAPLTGLICSLPLICIQHILSIYIKNFTFPLVIGIILSFPNFIISCYDFSSFFPYSYICKGMFFNVANSLNIKISVYTFSCIALLFIASILIGIKLFKNKDFK